MKEDTDTMIASGFAMLFLAFSTTFFGLIWVVPAFFFLIGITLLIIGLT
ncbi:MAG: hypothetical protein J7L23_00595 [Candidatus Diapherotrites archaeon]|nr:hypothetical protein [Candidatus Diapherotrites archaeon]